MSKSLERRFNHLLASQSENVYATAQHFKTAIDYLKRIFIRNGNPNSFFNLILRRFLNQLRQQLISTAEEEERKILFKVPCLGKISKFFFNNIRSAVKQKYGISIAPVYKTSKVGQYFQLKSQTYEHYLHRYLFPTSVRQS